MRVRGYNYLGTGLVFLALGWGLLSSSMRADTTINAPVTVQLQPVAMEKDGNTFYKYGIWVSLGGSSVPQLFEFDTGGSGFYAAYASNITNNWWGNDITLTGKEVHNHYGSGIKYKGFDVITSLSLYDPGSTTAKLTTGQNINVGQSIEITRDDVLIWPNETDEAPVERVFYGDFGLSLAPKSGNEEDVYNVFSQFSYGTGIVGAFIVSLSNPQENQGTSQVQIGATAEDLDSFPLKFTMNTNPDGSYSTELITATVTLSNGSTTMDLSLPINLDTGTPTPTFHEATDFIPEELLDSLTRTILAGTNLELYTQDLLEIFYGLSAGNIYGLNQIDSKSGGDTNYLNIGAPFFYEYDVLFDFENGVVGLRPSSVPEADSMGLLMISVVVVCFFAPRRRSASRR